MANPSARVPIATTPFAQAEVQKRDCSNTAQTFYNGEAVGLDSSGNVEKCDDTAALVFAGFVADSQRVTVESGDSAGDKKVNVERPRYAQVYIDETPAAGDEGRPVWWLFSNEVSYFARHDNTDEANFAGWVRRVVDTTNNIVEIELSLGAGAELVAVTIPYSSPADQYLFVADREYRLVDVRGRVLAGADFTGDIVKVADNTDIGNGTSLLAANTTYDFNGGNNLNQIVNLSTNNTVLEIDSGDAIALDVNATATNATGALTLLLSPHAR